MNRSTTPQNPQIKFILFVLLLILCWALGQFFHINEVNVKSWLLRYPLALSGAIFVVLYVGLTFFIWFTKDLLRIAGAYVFGAFLSTFLIWIAESINAVFLFCLSRFLGRSYVEGKMKGKYSRFDERLGHLKFWDLFALRAVVIVPYRFLDLACGLTRIPLKEYMSAVLLGSWLRIFFQQYFWIVLGNALFKDINISYPFSFIDNFRGNGYVPVSSKQILRITGTTQYFENHPMVGLLVIIYTGITVWVVIRMKRILWP